MAKGTVAPKSTMNDRRSSYSQSLVDSFANYQDHVITKGGSGRITPVRQHNRSKSIAKAKKVGDPMRSLQLMEKSGLVVPMRERFNEDMGKTIDDMKSQKSGLQGLTNKQMTTFEEDIKSQASRVSKRTQNKTLTQGELKDFFSRG
jgi:hypothetical protein